MRISVVGQIEQTCDSCGHVSSNKLWRAIDLVERPQLRTWLAEGSWASAPCSKCGAGVERAEPLLVTRLDPIAPVLLAVSDEQQDFDKAVSKMQPVLLQVQHALGRARLSTPGPILRLTFDVLAFAATRDLAVDVKTLPSVDSIIEGSRHGSAELYKLFLIRIRKSADQRRFELALDQLLTVDGPAEFERILQTHPELLSQAARDEFSNRAANVAAGPIMTTS